MTDRGLKLIGVVVAIGVHAGVVGGVAAMNAVDRQHTERRARAADDQMVTIEAGLAIKQKIASGRRTSMPTKDVAAKVRPQPQRGVATDPDAPVDPSATRRDDPAVPPDMIDPNSVFDKYRAKDTIGDPMASGVGGDDENVAGSPDGSEWGTLDEAKGDPYVGELVGRMTTNPELVVPSIVSDTGLETLGCVRLDADGRIVDRTVPDEGKSRNRTFNRAVEERLKATTDMDKPVPAHLKDLLETRGICVPYRY